MTKKEAYNKELNKLNEIFQDVEESDKKLVEGLIQDAAFLYAENYSLKKILDETGMIKIHPDNPSLQKPLPIAKEYRQNLNSYSIVVKSLSSVLQKKIDDDDDDMGDYE
ncbi:hypothetical protein CLPUN_09620 [Clostridium puniceum]|uniref:Phage terminase, small subunit n=1 Tax=Clostridium puniceum TaxID=29367 RepID=A0A1S8TVP3_9CLOT|nr:hypothetical protein [Clostridium puniceum]OOM81778.1 hypothetical protein CLPUN_09620 [Clostridium puniceum]